MTRICPKCDKEITSLRNIITGSIEYHLSLDIQGDVDYETREFHPDGDIDEHRCPECDEILFTSDTKAIAFLKGE